jgi:hypothetical protein
MDAGKEATTMDPHTRQTVSYDTHEAMQRDVERRSDEGWIVRRITSLAGDACEVEYAQMAQHGDDTG